MKPIAYVTLTVRSGRTDSFTIERVRQNYELGRREGEDRTQLATFCTEAELRALLEKSHPSLAALSFSEKYAARAKPLAQFLEATEGPSDEFSARRHLKEIAQLREVDLNR